MSKRFVLAIALASAMVASAAQSAVIFSGYQTAPNAGEVVATGFEGGPTLGGVLFNLSGFTLTGDAVLATGSLGGITAAPGFNASTRDTTQYLSVQKNKSAILSTPELDAISFYVGSLDGWNSFTFHLANGATEVVTGAILAALPGMDANGSQNGFTSNGRLTFSFDSAITGVTFFSSSNALEISDISVLAAVVPEPTSWAMMIVGVGGLGMVMRRRRSMAFA